MIQFTTVILADHDLASLDATEPDLIKDSSLQEFSGWFESRLEH